MELKCSPISIITGNIRSLTTRMEAVQPLDIRVKRKNIHKMQNIMSNPEHSLHHSYKTPGCLQSEASSDLQ